MTITITYSQSNGLIVNSDGGQIAAGWAGHGQGKNNPIMEDVQCVGPLPRGLYRVGEWQTHPRLGQHCAPLTQVQGESFGRSGFWIHGPSRDPEKYGQESEGCIVVPHDPRLGLEALAPDYVQVIA